MSYDPLITELSAIKESLKKIQDRITRASS